MTAKWRNLALYIALTLDSLEAILHHLAPCCLGCSRPLIQKGARLMSQLKHLYFCWMCGKLVELETCKTDEHGMAVHENCYASKIVQQGKTIDSIKMTPQSTHFSPDQAFEVWHKRRFARLW